VTLISDPAHPTGRKREEHIMSPDQHKNAQPNEDQPHKIDRNAPAGTANSLGAESIRDGRPATDDSVVGAIDELSPGEISPPNRDKR
jgi:hypothetical protein